MKIIHTGCWHLGHPRTPTEHICNSIELSLFSMLEKDMLLFHAGDVLDNVCSVDDPSIIHINNLFDKLATLAVDKNITIRMMRGTYFHDRNQLPYIENIMLRHTGIDFKLITQVSIEHIPKYDIWVGYLPDNTAHRNTFEVISDFQKLMKAHGISQLDYLITHGMYDVINLPIHKGLILNLDELSTLVKRRILSGHIHTPSSHGKLLYAGSIDRLAHNEEHEKGYWLIDHDTDKATFIVNCHAYPYITIDMIGKDCPEDLQLFFYSQGNLIQHCDEGIVRLRILIDKKGLITLKPYIHKWFSEHYPLVSLTFVDKDKEFQNRNARICILPSDTKLELINEVTLPNMLHQRLTDKGMSEITLEKLKNILHK